MIRQYERSRGRVLGFNVSGKLDRADFQGLEPVVAAAVARHERIRMLVHFQDFAGWDINAFWQDAKFGVRHFTDIERLAIVGDTLRDTWFARLSKPFTTALVRQFRSNDLPSAWLWVEETPRIQQARLPEEESLSSDSLLPGVKAPVVPDSI